MHRYLVLVWDPHDADAVSQFAQLEPNLPTANSCWELAYRCPGVYVAHVSSTQQSTAAHKLANHHGVVLGHLFRRGSLHNGTVERVHLDEVETERIVNSNGRHLVRNYWGSYLAVVRNKAGTSCGILRDPTGTLSCYHLATEHVHVFFSDIEDLNKYVPAAVTIDWSYTAAHLLTGGYLSRKCGLKEIEDLPGGEWVDLSRGKDIRMTLWMPSDFCGTDDIEDEHKAASELRSTVHTVVQALASQHSDILVRLSGGLDSSIVTACLAQSPAAARVTCLNFYISGNGRDELNGSLPSALSKENLAKMRRVIGSADERQFARAVAKRYGLPLIEREKLVTDWDFERIFHAPLSPRPSNYVFVLDEEPSEIEYVTKTNATACFTGSAGDTVFYCTLRAIGALDYARLHPLGPHLLRYIGITASLSGESIAHVAGKVLKHGYFRAPLPSPFDPTKAPHLISDEVARSVSTACLEHPWITGSTRLCPGKRNHVHGVATSVPAYHRVCFRDRIAASVHPLASQPVVETCLRIPTYVLLADGISRGLARRAFRDLLPPEVVRRTVKGLGVAFWQKLLTFHVTTIRECLLDGILVRERLLDRRKLEDYLTQDQPFLTVHPKQIMDYLACEGWLSQWASRSLVPRGVMARSLDQRL